MGGVGAVFAIRKLPLERYGLGFLRRYRSNSHAMVIVMASGAMLSFWRSYVAGRDSMYLMDPLLERTRYKSMTPYQKAIHSDRYGFGEEEEMMRKMDESHR